MKAVIVTSIVFVLLLAGPVFATEGGEAVYKKACAACHDNGVAGAPKIGDDKTWAPLISDGMDELYDVAINGKGAMPAKGGHKNLTDAEVKSAVDYMVDESQ